MRIGAAVDFGEGVGEVVGDGVGGGECVFSGLDGDGAVAACGPDELLHAPAGLVLDPVGEGHGCEHDREVGVDRFSFVVVDRAGL